MVRWLMSSRLEGNGKHYPYSLLEELWKITNTSVRIAFIVAEIQKEDL
jgi:hypothetical protein